MCQNFAYVSKILAVKEHHGRARLTLEMDSGHKDAKIVFYPK